MSEKKVKRTDDKNLQAMGGSGREGIRKSLDRKGGKPGAQAEDERSFQMTIRKEGEGKGEAGSGRGRHNG